MMDTKKLLNQIECLRERMIDVGLKKGIANEESLKISRELDHLINVFNQNRYRKDN